MITVIRHQKTDSGFKVVVTDISNNTISLQCYREHEKNHATSLEFSGAFDTEDSAIFAFQYGITKDQIAELIQVYKTSKPEASPPKFAIAGSAEGLVVVVDGETGYYKLPSHWKYDCCMQRSYDYAEAINEDFLQLSDKGMAIIAQSMK